MTGAEEEHDVGRVAGEAPMPILLQGTTRYRAERIVSNGPDLDFIEPGGGPPADEFSALLDTGRTDIVGSAEEYAVRKAANFPGEGGPVVLAVEVPEVIVELTFDAFLPRSQGLVQFDREGEALRLLLQAWPGLPKQIRQVQAP
jgi:hypothetical protein